MNSRSGAGKCVRYIDLPVRYSNNTFRNGQQVSKYIVSMSRGVYSIQ